MTNELKLVEIEKKLDRLLAQSSAESAALLPRKLFTLRKENRSLNAEVGRLRAVNHRMMEAGFSEFEYERLVEWFHDPKRKPAIHAFTAGAARTAAYAFEDSLRAALGRDI
jgi:hypothetical protein